MKIKIKPQSKAVVFIDKITELRNKMRAVAATRFSACMPHALFIHITDDIINEIEWNEFYLNLTGDL